MRRSVGLLLLAVAGFLGVLAAVVPTFVLGALTVAPEDYYGVFRLRAEGAEGLDQASGRVLTGLTVESVSTVRGDVNAATADLVVWDGTTTVQTSTGIVLSYSDRRVAFDKTSGLVVTCCGAYVGESDVEQSGLAYKWPYFAGRRSYPFFDPVTLQTQPMRYEGEERLSGLTVYRYRQTIPDRRVGPVPGGVLPAATPDRDVPASLYASVDRTYWVEPVTGTPLRVHETQNQTIRTADGATRLTALAADFHTPPEETAAHANDLRPTVAILGFARGPALWMCGGTAAIALVAGLLLYRPERPRSVESDGVENDDADGDDADGDDADGGGVDGGGGSDEAVDGSLAQGERRAPPDDAHGISEGSDMARTTDTG
ncbi:hypothetical protein Aph01nite_08970 [Acrocarpospora phusangensis]|uniref:DUF3068 domain-containing protein n=1 Tax=Acrocarpospora phusangensis TaxID=1070424 RepID=A0A919QA21_9ACTN|nr:DUF3068 domain-containing protein [Acrocarpospora phusangensis]GIH22587.1 hypothetical protein Aph01nite_08970 [Acrocarpospora phusangensis]